MASVAIVAGSRSPLCLIRSFGGQLSATPRPLLGRLLCSLMPCELPSLGPAPSQHSLHPWSSEGALPFAGTSVKIPLLSLKSPCCVWNPPWTRVLSSWARSGSAPCLSCEPATCPTAPGCGFCLSNPGPAAPLGGGQARAWVVVSLAGPHFPLYLSVQPRVSCSSLEHSAAEKPACWQAGLLPPPLPEPQPYSFVLPSPGS